MKILIIDDDVQVCETIESLVARTGHNSISSYNLTDGLAKVKKDDFDLVFLDISLPDGNGLDYLQQVKDSAGNPEIIILNRISNYKPRVFLDRQDFPAD